MPVVNPYKRKRKRAPPSTPVSVVTNDITQSSPDHSDGRHHTTSVRRRLDFDAVATPTPPRLVSQEEEKRNSFSSPSSGRLRSGWCMDRSQGIKCYCCKVKFSQDCRACGGRIQQGDCAHSIDVHGWMHTRCDCDEGRDRCSALFNGFLPLSAPLRLAWESPIQEKKKAASQRLLLTNFATSTSTSTQSYNIHNNNHNTINNTNSSSNGAVSVIHTYQQEDNRHSEEAFGLTEEQYAVVEHRAKRGDLIRIKARAGTGKTTTVAFLCHELLRRNPRERILYIIFAANGSISAKKEGKFPKYMSIMTSHSYALHCLQMKNFRHLKSNYNKKNIITKLGLEDWVTQTFFGGEMLHTGGSSSFQKIKRRCSTIAGYIIKTIERFQQSDDYRVVERHVYWKATMVVGVVSSSTTTSSNTKFEWRSKISKQQYVSWAQEIFNAVYQFCTSHSQLPNNNKNPPPPALTDITHDGYFKSLHISRLGCPRGGVPVVGTQYDVIIVDECQDMNACQASVLWGGTIRRKNNNPTVYLVGDDRQRLYRFRGASRNFEACTATQEFQLTGSFRFGQTIGNVATQVLQQKGHSEDRVQGLSLQGGQILPSGQFERGVVICRTNNGIYEYLQSTKPRRWGLYSKNTASSPQQYYRELKVLLLFLRGQSRSFVCDGDEFASFKELVSYCTETDHTDMLNKISMVKKYHEEETDVVGLFEGLGNSFVSDWRASCSSVNDFDGVILLTCHKAKGLEFNNVCVYDDFRFDDIMKLEKEHLLANEYCREMIDLVYVSFTRTKHVLYLCDGGMRYIEWLKKQQLHDSNKDGITIDNSNLLEAESTLSELRDDAELLWHCFVTETDKVTSVGEIPWPLGTEDNPFCFEPSMTLAEQVKTCKTMLFRYHPDKFFQNFGSRLALASEEVDRVKEKVNKLTHAAMKLRRDLRPLEQA